MLLYKNVLFMHIIVFVKHKRSKFTVRIHSLNIIMFVLKQIIQIWSGPYPHHANKLLIMIEERLAVYARSGILS